MEIAVAVGATGLGLVGLIIFLVLRLVNTTYRLGVETANNKHLAGAIERMVEESKRRRDFEKRLSRDMAAIDSGDDSDLDRMLLVGTEDPGPSGDKAGPSGPSPALETEDSPAL